MQNIMERIGFTVEEQTYFTGLYDMLSKQDLAELEQMQITYMNPEILGPEVSADIMQQLTAFAQKKGIQPYSMHMLFLLMCAPLLPGLYQQKGLDEKFAYNLLCDLRYKLTECEKCTNIMGTTTFLWFRQHFLVRRFGIGYFQYDPYQWDLDAEYHFGDIHIKKGDPVYKIHIPSAGNMTREKRLASYCAVHDFFGYKKGQPIVLFCRTWFLYEKYQQCFPEGSNIRDFRDDFDMVEELEVDRFNDAWRIFNCEYDDDTSVLPRDTRLQRNFITYLENGGNFGSGAGVIICDGERILNNKRDNP